MSDKFIRVPDDVHRKLLEAQSERQLKEGKRIPFHEIIEDCLNTLKIKPKV